jgi:hypothetical protein
MADAAPAGEDTGAQETQQQGLDPQMLEQLSGMPAQLEQMRTQMEEQARTWAASQEQPPAEDEPVDLSFVDPNSPNYAPERAAQELIETLQREQQSAVQDAIKPLQQQLSTLEFDRAAEKLEGEFSELSDPQVAEEVLKTTREWVGLAGLPQEAADNPQVIRAVILMNKAADAHNQEVNGPQPTAATLEGAAGATPGGTGGGITAQDIIGAQRRSPLPF